MKPVLTAKPVQGADVCSPHVRALEGTHGGIRKDPNGTYARPLGCVGHKYLHPTHAHPWRDAQRCMRGASMHAPHTRAIMVDPIGDSFTPPPRHLCPSWWGAYYIRGCICLRPLTFTVILAQNCFPWLLARILGGSLRAHPLLLPFFIFKLNF